VNNIRASEPFAAGNGTEVAGMGKPTPLYQSMNFLLSSFFLLEKERAFGETFGYVLRPLNLRVYEIVAMPYVRRDGACPEEESSHPSAHGA
jgi:hypothetical protein